MRIPHGSLAVLLCALSAGAALAQSTATSTVTKTPGITFSYDAQHDQVIPNGVQLKPAATGAAITPTTGTVVVTINITTASHFPRGTSYHCSVVAVGGELDTTNAVVSGGIDTAFGVAHSTGANTFSCKLTIPYEWTILPDPAATRGAILAFGVAAVEDGNVVRSTLQADGVEPLPPDGTTSTFSFNVTL